MPGPPRRVIRRWDHTEQDLALTPRDGLMSEVATGDGRFEQLDGPFEHYDRSVVASADGGGLIDTTTYRLEIPWFRWLFALPVR